MVEGGGLLNRYTGENLYRGFKSLPLRHLFAIFPLSGVGMLQSVMMTSSLLITIFSVIPSIMVRFVSVSKLGQCWDRFCAAVTTSSTERVSTLQTSISA